MAVKVGERTVAFQNDISIEAFASAVGPKERQGPLSKYFDLSFQDEFLGEDSFEKAESALQKAAVKKALEKAGLNPQDIDVIYAGDLLNQCIGSAYGLRSLDIPFIGLYGACSTMALSILNAAVAIESGVAEKAAAVTSSHFCSSERQFRFPLEYGGQRTPTAQWTVTGSGAAILGKNGGNLKVKQITVGKIVDYEITDMNNMGAAMAPAAADTILSFLKDTNTSPSDYDLILTGDLGFLGSELLVQLIKKEGISLENHNDCGMLIFDRESQDVHSGGSGCGCAASVLCSYILKKMQKGELKNILFCATGALMSPTSSMQGESIPSIAHLVNIKAE